MGNWNETCAISQLPIRRDDEVVVFLLRATTIKFTPNGIVGGIEKAGGGFTSSESLFEIISLPFRGDYNESGLVNNIEGKEGIILKEFKDIYYSPNLLAPGRVKEIEVSSLSELMELIKNRKISGYSFILIHKEIYEKAIKATAETFRYLDTTINEEVQGWISKYAEQLEEIKKEVMADSSIENKDATINFLITTEDSSIKGRLSPMRECLKHIDDKNIEELITETLLFKEFMTLTNKLITPQVGSGGADEFYNLIGVVSDYVGQIVKEGENNEI